MPVPIITKHDIETMSHVSSDDRQSEDEAIIVTVLKFVKMLKCHEGREKLTGEDISFE
jgi:hypothetical protein